MPIIFKDGVDFKPQEATEFHIQRGRDKKASYKTESVVVGDVIKAITAYRDATLNVGQKKRLMADGKVLAILNLSNTPSLTD